MESGGRRGEQMGQPSGGWKKSGGDEKKAGKLCCRDARRGWGRILWERSVCVCVCVYKWSSVYTCVSVQQGRSAETQVPADGAAELL